MFSEPVEPNFPPYKIASLEGFIQDCGFTQTASEDIAFIIIQNDYRGYPIPTGYLLFRVAWSFIKCGYRIALNLPEGMEYYEYSKKYFTRKIKDVLLPPFIIEEVE